jgi:hypothetical protein
MRKVTFLYVTLVHIKLMSIRACCTVDHLPPYLIVDSVLHMLGNDEMLVGGTRCVRDRRSRSGHHVYEHSDINTKTRSSSARKNFQKHAQKTHVTLAHEYSVSWFIYAWGISNASRAVRCRLYITAAHAEPRVIGSNLTHPHVKFGLRGNVWNRKSRSISSVNLTCLEYPRIAHGIMHNETRSMRRATKNSSQFFTQLVDEHEHEEFFLTFAMYTVYRTLLIGPKNDLLRSLQSLVHPTTWECATTVWLCVIRMWFFPFFFCLPVYYSAYYSVAVYQQL